MTYCGPVLKSSLQNSHLINIPNYEQKLFLNEVELDSFNDFAHQMDSFYNNFFWNENARNPL